MSIDATLEHIDTWLAHHASATHRSLRPGHPDPDQHPLATSMGQALHEDAATLWHWHNGADGQAHAFQLAPQFDFLSLDSAAYFRQQWTDRAQENPLVLWRSTWLPIGSDGCGNLMVVDHSAGESYGNVFLISPHAGNLVYDLAASPADLLGSLLHALRDGEPFDGHHAQLETGGMEWVPDEHIPPTTYNRPYHV
jgi:cell wall assembly regulator SMI1